MKRYRLNKGKFARFIFEVLCIAFIGWFFVSYLDVVIHNLQDGYNYPSWNLLANIFNK